MARHVASVPSGRRQVLLIPAVIAGALLMAMAGFLIVATVVPDTTERGRAAPDPTTDREGGLAGPSEGPTADGGPTPTPTPTRTPAHTATRPPTPSPSPTPPATPPAIPQRRAPRPQPEAAAAADAGQARVAFDTRGRVRGGFVTTVTITNTTDEPLRWLLGFTYSAAVDDVWDADVEQAGDRVTARGVEGDAQVPPGDRVRFGFSATGKQTRPTGCTLNGSPCVFVGGSHASASAESHPTGRKLVRCNLTGRNPLPGAGRAWSPAGGSARESWPVLHFTTRCAFTEDQPTHPSGLDPKCLRRPTFLNDRASGALCR